MSKKVNQRLFRPLLNTDNIEQEVLPEVTDADDGKVLTVVDGEWDKADASKELPTVNNTDDGKILKVVDGVWNKAEASGGNDDEVVAHLEFDPMTAGFKLDKTFAELYSAYNNGKAIAVFLSGRKVYVSKVKTTEIIFFDFVGRSIDTANNKINFIYRNLTINDSNVVTYTDGEGVNDYKIAYTT